MTTATEVWRIPIAGMTCDHCVRTVSQALSAVPGVESVQVDLPGAWAEVTVDPSRAVFESLSQAIAAAGYSVPMSNGVMNMPKAVQSAQAAPPVTIRSKPAQAP